jgi:hypothetical protein
MTTTDVNALLVDDQAGSDYVQGVIRTAAPLGLSIRPVDPDELVEAVSRYSPQVLIVDAKMKVSARRLARSAVKEKEELAVFFWTEFAADVDLRDLGYSLNPLTKCGVGMKAPRADTSGEILRESLVVPVKTLVERPHVPDIWPLNDQPKARSRVFEMTVDDYNGQSLDVARELLAEAHQEVAERVHHIFRNTDSEWLLIAGPDMDVIRWGATLANMPDSRRIFELGLRFRYVPLLFTRPMEVDEIDSPQSSRSWVECPPADFYPCLGIDFTGSSIGTKQIHLDTGSAKTFLSLERLRAARIVDEIRPIDLRPGEIERSKQKIQYIDRDVRIVLSDGGEATALHIRAMVVFDWDQSPFARFCHHGNCPGSQKVGGPAKWTCGMRAVGLLGRDVLIQGRLRVILDGVERKTRFLRQSDENHGSIERPWRYG